MFRQRPSEAGQNSADTVSHDPDDADIPQDSEHKASVYLVLAGVPIFVFRCGRRFRTRRLRCVGGCGGRSVGPAERAAEDAEVAHDAEPDGNWDGECQDGFEILAGKAGKFRGRRTSKRLHRDRILVLPRSGNDAGILADSRKLASRSRLRWSKDVVVREENTQADR